MIRDDEGATWEVKESVLECQGEGTEEFPSRSLQVVTTLTRMREMRLVWGGPGGGGCAKPSLHDLQHLEPSVGSH